MKLKGYPVWVNPLAAVAFLVVLSVIFFLRFPSNRPASEESVQKLRDSILRSATQCYALEGAYPPSVEYLEEHYGLLYDKKRFTVEFQTWEQANVKPTVIVIPKT